MPPRKASARRNKSSSKKAPNPVIDHELPAPEVKAETELTDDLKVKETEPEMLVLSDPNCAKIEEAILTNRSVGDVNASMDEDHETVFRDGVVKEDLQEFENVDEEKQLEELEKDQETTSAQEETTADDNDQDSDISNTLCKNNDVVVTTEIVSVQDVSTQTSREDDIVPAVKDDSMLNLDDDDDDDDDDGSDDYSEGDDEDNEADDPSLIAQASSSGNKKEKGTEIYVGKLDKDTVEDDLVNVFQRFGELKATRIVRKPNSNKSKGFGFVRFASVDQAKRALSELKDGVEVQLSLSI